jgi:putative SOS response-associated peptidase YedK
MASIHDRMPALLRPEEMQKWLAGSGSVLSQSCLDGKIWIDFRLMIVEFGFLK